MILDTCYPSPLNLVGEEETGKKKAVLEILSSQMACGREIELTENKSNVVGKLYVCNVVTV